MGFDAGLVLTWVLFLALFPMFFFWTRRTWRIFVKKDYSEVALKRGEPPVNAKKWAPFTGIINLLGAVVAGWTIIGVVVLGYPYEKWSAMAGTVIWMKIFADWIIRMQAHPIKWGKKKKEAVAS
ncbi:MAG: hypothetical protein C0602_02195 [Denitrovibrio sp.]|mgnify:CR=1 FL=1|nr:MAG: hypothetical protein C0602_02195 [Denitrovibrio sp.]